MITESFEQFLFEAFRLFLHNRCQRVNLVNSSNSTDGFMTRSLVSVGLLNKREKHDGKNCSMLKSSTENKGCEAYSFRFFQKI